MAILASFGFCPVWSSVAYNLRRQYRENQAKQPWSLLNVNWLPRSLRLPTGCLSFAVVVQLPERTEMAIDIGHYLIVSPLSDNIACSYALLLRRFFSRHSLFLGWLLRVDLIKWVSNVRLYIRPSTKRFFDFNKIWYIGRDRWVMHDGMQYDPIQGQDQGHDSRSLQSRKSGHF